MVRLVNSGTEATMCAIRVARGFTGRDLTVKFEGCYHGHVDSLLVKAGSGHGDARDRGHAGRSRRRSPKPRIALPYNSIAAVEQAFREHGAQIAAVIVEPVVGNMGCVPPAPGFLEALRELTARHGALLIFDEVMTGFRVALGGAQQRLRHPPDLTHARQDHRRRPAGRGLRRPRGHHAQGRAGRSGLPGGNALRQSAGGGRGPRDAAPPEGASRDLRRSWKRAPAQLCANPPAGITVNRVGSMFTFFFTDQPVTDWESAKRRDTARFGRFFRFMLERGIYLAPSQFEAAFLSAAHTDEDIRHTVERRGSFSPPRAPEWRFRYPYPESGQRACPDGLQTPGLRLDERHVDCIADRGDPCPVFYVM